MSCWCGIYSGGSKEGDIIGGCLVVEVEETV